MLSPQQNRLYRPLVAKAWAAYCARRQLDPCNRVNHARWYQRELLNAFGFVTTKAAAIDKRLFESMCLHFATVAGDIEAIAYWTSADERRALWRLEQNMKRAKLDWPYVNGIAKRMHLLDDMHPEIRNLPAKHILKLSTALFLYMKRSPGARVLEEVPL